jgi:hypothetical protein
LHTPLALVLPYAALLASFVLGYLAISRAVIIEPPAFVTTAIAALSERMVARRSAMIRQAS